MCDEQKEEKLCLICGKNLRPLIKKQDSETRQIHVTCWNNLIKDLNNFHKVAYTKYGYTRMIAGMPEEEARKQKSFKVVFD